jgi:hypothetical protein
MNDWLEKQGIGKKAVNYKFPRLDLQAASDIGANPFRLYIAKLRYCTGSRGPVCRSHCLKWPPTLLPELVKARW